MNQRIRELWAQCVIKHTKTPMNWQNAADEFAELIVRECLSITKKQYNDTLPWGGVEDTIKEHFGVEE